jgi:hypothetical protein
MFRFLSSLRRTRTGTARRKSTPAPRRTRLCVEALEDRFLLSVAHIHTHVIHKPVTSVVVQNPILLQQGQYTVLYPVVNVPSLQGVSFHLLSSNGKPAHDLSIQSETWLADGSATITGTWKGDKGGNVQPITNGTLKFDAQGNISISFSWNNGQNSLQGTITRVYNSRYSQNYIYGYHWHLEGDVKTANPGGGPGHVSGDGQLPPLVTANY